MTTWDGNIVSLKNNKVEYVYAVERLGQGKERKHGLYIGTINRDNEGEISSIVGNYKDDIELNHGTTTWSRLAPKGHPEYKPAA